MNIFDATRKLYNASGVPRQPILMIQDHDLPLTDTKTICVNS